jgi:hypothetical protein
VIGEPGVSKNGQPEQKLPPKRASERKGRCLLTTNQITCRDTRDPRPIIDDLFLLADKGIEDDGAVEVDDGDSSEGRLGPFWTDADHLAIDGEKLAGSAEMEEQVVVRRGGEMAVIGEGKEEGGRKMRCGESRRGKN